VDTDLALGLAAARPACETDDKVLVRRLTEAVRWQPEAAAAVASAIAKAKSGDGKRRGAGAKADAWIVFAGPDVVGKRDMAEALSKSVFGAGAVTVRLGCPPAGDDGGESVVSCRGRTALDRVAEAIGRTCSASWCSMASTTPTTSCRGRSYARSSPAGSRTRAAGTSPSAATS